jgi:hypothetical protein
MALPLLGAGLENVTSSVKSSPTAVYALLPSAD